jgi:hypothetical protein
MGSRQKSTILHLSLSQLNKPFLFAVFLVSRKSYVYYLHLYTEDNAISEIKQKFTVCNIVCESTFASPAYTQFFYPESV